MQRTAIAALSAACMIGLAACSESPPTQEPPPPAREIDVRYTVRFNNSDGGYTIRGVEFANEQGVVEPVKNPLPMWSRDLTLRPGDRMYVRAEVAYEGAFWAAVQVLGPDGMYYVSECTRVDGPDTCVVEIDRIVE